MHASDLVKEKHGDGVPHSLSLQERREMAGISKQWYAVIIKLLFREEEEKVAIAIVIVRTEREGACVCVCVWEGRRGLRGSPQKLFFG